MIISPGCPLLRADASQWKCARGWLGFGVVMPDRPAGLVMPDLRVSELLEAAREASGVDGVTILAPGDFTHGPHPLVQALGRLRKAVRAFDPPAPTRHTFGGVVFEETGEVRFPEAGEWYCYCGGIWLHGQHSATVVVVILRPVGLEPKEGA